MSSEAIWLCVRKNNAFTRKSVAGTPIFSCEKGNLKGMNSYKYSGLANATTMSVSAAGAADDLAININGAVSKGYDVKQIVRKVQKTSTRADLTADAVSKVTYLHKALRAAKAGVKKSKA